MAEGVDCGVVGGSETPAASRAELDRSSRDVASKARLESGQQNRRTDQGGLRGRKDMTCRQTQSKKVREEVAARWRARRVGVEWKRSSQGPRLREAR